MKKLSRVEYDILNALYFVERYENLVDEVEAEIGVLNDCLKQLIDKKLVAPLYYNEDAKDYVKTFMYDGDNLNQYAFLATKEGLMLHNNSIIDDEE